MTTSITALAAAEHAADLRREAEQQRRTRVQPVARTQSPTIALRLARPDEADLVQRLAELDDAPSLDGPVLVAYVDDEAVAALSLADKRVVANPFVASAETVALLRVRAQQLGAERDNRGLRLVRRLRLA